MAVGYWAVAAAEYSRAAAAFLLAGCFRAVSKHSDSAAHAYSARPPGAAVRSVDWRSAVVRSGLDLPRADAPQEVYSALQAGWHLPTHARAPHPAH